MFFLGMSVDGIRENRAEQHPTVVNRESNANLLTNGPTRGESLYWT